MRGFLLNAHPKSGLMAVMAEPMTAPQLVARAGRLIYGPQWQRAMANDLDLQERTIQRIAQAEKEGRDYPVAPGVLTDLADILEARAAPALDAARQLRAHVAKA